MILDWSAHIVMYVHGRQSESAREHARGCMDRANEAIGIELSLALTMSNYKTVDIYNT